jgi:hypothetical protein
MHFVGAFHEGIDESVGDLAENRTNDFFEHLAGELVRQLELNFAGVVGQGLETPQAFKAAKRAINQVDSHPLRRLLVVLGGEVRSDIAVIDVQGGNRSLLVAKLAARLAAPG